MKYLATLLFVCAFAVQARAQISPAVLGDYVEARSGHVYTCGCLYSGETVTAGREAILVWRIARGDYQGVPLAGIKVAAVVVGESNLGAEATPRRAALYVDSVTSDAQREALLALWQKEYSRVLGKIESVKDAPISLEQQDGTVRVVIPGIARLELRKARLPQDAHPGSFLWYGPFAPLSDPTLATSLLYEYWGSVFQRQWRDLTPAISGYFGKFEIAARN